MTVDIAKTDGQTKKDKTGYTPMWKLGSCENARLDMTMDIAKTDGQTEIDETGYKHNTTKQGISTIYKYGCVEQ